MPEQNQCAPETEIVAYWRKRCYAAEERETALIVDRAKLRDALAEIEAMVPKNSPIETIAAKALGFPFKS